MADNTETTTLSDAEYKKLQMQAGAATPLVFGGAFVDGLEAEMKKKFIEPEQVQEVDEFVGKLKNNSELSEALRTSVAQDGSVIRGMLSADENDLAAVNDALAAPGGTNKFVDALKAIAENPNDDITFTSSLRPLFSAATGPVPATPAVAPAAPAPATPAAATPAVATPAPPATTAPAAPVIAVPPAIGAMSQDVFIGTMAGLIQTADNSPEMRTAVNELTENLKANPNLTTALQNAMVKDPSMATGLAGSGDPATSGVAEIQALNTMLKNPDNVTLMTNTMNAIAKSPDDSINFDLVKKLSDLGKKMAKGEATQDDYRSMNKRLADAGIVDDRISLMEDPSKMWDMFLKEPEKMVQMMMNEFGSDLSPEMRNMFAGVATVASKMVSAFIDPNGDFVGHYYNNVIKPIGGAISKVGAQTMDGEDLSRRLEEAGTAIPSTPSDLGSTINIDDRRESVLSNRASQNRFADAAHGVDPAVLAAQKADIVRNTAEIGEMTQRRAEPAPATP